ncbi:MAG: hypothetical protein LBQ61_00365, partial [Spirochaetales bacterium]|nr:hypothetical protein [Spirochaetales bacterium]
TGNFRLRGFRLSPLAGFYGVFPLGETRYRDSAGAKDAYPWSFSLPLGWTAGLEGAVIYGPGRVVAGLRFSADFGTVTIRNSEERQYRRNMASLYLGYEFGFYGGKSRGED